MMGVSKFRKRATKNEVWSDKSFSEPSLLLFTENFTVMFYYFMKLLSQIFFPRISFQFSTTCISVLNQNNLYIGKLAGHVHLNIIIFTVNGNMSIQINRDKFAQEWIVDVQEESGSQPAVKHQFIASVKNVQYF